MYGKRRERARASERSRRLVEKGLERKSIRGNPLSRRMFSRRVPRRRHRRRRRRRHRACATLAYIDLSPSLSSSQTPGSPVAGAFPRARFPFFSSPSLRSRPSRAFTGKRESTSASRRLQLRFPRCL